MYTVGAAVRAHMYFHDIDPRVQLRRVSKQMLELLSAITRKGCWTADDMHAGLLVLVAT